MGAPFMTPACVRTVSHASALTVMNTKVAPGESPTVEGAHEQRLSALLVSVFIGLSIFLASLLKLVPNAVLYGVFLYMGISATAGIQFLDRVILFFVPIKHHPNTAYVKKVRFVFAIFCKKKYISVPDRVILFIVPIKDHPNTAYVKKVRFFAIQFLDR